MNKKAIYKTNKTKIFTIAARMLGEKKITKEVYNDLRKFKFPVEETSNLKVVDEAYVKHLVEIIHLREIAMKKK